MTKHILLAAFSLCCFFARAQKDYNVLFDLTSKDSLDQRALLRWVNEITGAHPDAHVEVVMYGQGLNLVVKGRTSMEEAVTRIAGNPNVNLRVCAVAMKNQHVEQSELLPGVQTVPDGIYEIITKQRQGWGYIKAVH